MALKKKSEYARGVEAVASLLESTGWDGLVAATPYRLSDIVRLKFNLINKNQVRRLYPRKKPEFKTLPRRPG